MVKKCPYCKDENSVSILYKGNGNKDKSISVECTSHNSQDVEQWKPNLYKCELCKLVFSEFIGVDFASKYVDVIDQSYIDQIEFKKKTFNLFFKKIEKHLNKDIKVLEIGSYYGVLGSLIKTARQRICWYRIVKSCHKLFKRNFWFRCDLRTSRRVFKKK